MNTTLSWIKAYVPDLTCTAQEYHRCNDPLRNEGGGI